MFTTPDNRFTIKWTGISHYSIWFYDEKIVHEEPSFNQCLIWLLDKDYISYDEWEDNRQKGFIN